MKKPPKKMRLMLCLRAFMYASYAARWCGGVGEEPGSDQGREERALET